MDSHLPGHTNIRLARILLQPLVAQSAHMASRVGAIHLPSLRFTIQKGRRPHGLEFSASAVPAPAMSSRGMMIVRRMFIVGIAVEPELRSMWRAAGALTRLANPAERITTSGVPPRWQLGATVRQRLHDGSHPPEMVCRELDRPVWPQLQATASNWK